jgi:molybdopterin molybdotransferase
MITLEEAQEILSAIPVKPIEEKESIQQALNRILAQDVESMIDMPPFDKSAMDGYAVNSEDNSMRFQVMEIISAGIIPANKIKKGQCAKIMTGGVVPQGANQVVKREVTVEEDGFMRIVDEDPNRNICLRGEDVKAGDVVLKKGVRIRAQEIGVLASMGLSVLNVYRRPVVCILSTGSELVEPGNHLAMGQIYNSNSYSLAAQVSKVGAVANPSGIVPDSITDIKATLENVLKSSDLVMLSGGVSMGDFDYVPGILNDLGFTLHFEKVSIKPGKPTVFATRKQDVVFGIPGNPVSTFVVFEIFIKPLLYRMMGHDYKPVLIPVVLKSDIRRKRAARTSFVPVHWAGGQVEPLPYHGSAHFHALSKANGLICIPKGVTEILGGSRIDVRPI